MILQDHQEEQDMYQVLFYSRGGNTRKLADAIAEELGTKAADVKDATIDPAAGMIFLGSGCYGSKPGQDMAKFIEAHDFSGRKVALFSTSSGGAGNELRVMADALNRKGAIVLGKHTCKGKFLVMNRGRPNLADLDGAKKFAREMVKNG
jgi:flavodoxin